MINTIIDFLKNMIFGTFIILIIALGLAVIVFLMMCAYTVAGVNTFMDIPSWIAWSFFVLTFLGVAYAVGRAYDN
jgi:hypothetical protein